MAEFPELLLTTTGKSPAAGGVSPALVLVVIFDVIAES